MSDEWDGHERRAVTPQTIAEQMAPIIKSANGTSATATNTSRIVIAGAVIVLQLTTIAQHVLVSGDIENESDRQAGFRQTVSCFLFEITRPAGGEVDRADVLARCGLIGVGGESLDQQDR